MKTQSTILIIFIGFFVITSEKLIFSIIYDYKILTVLPNVSMS